MKGKIFILGLLLMNLSIGIHAQEEGFVKETGTGVVIDPVKNSVQSGERWLHLLDERNYSDSWEAASLTLRLTVPKNHWVTLMESVRKPLGSLTSRKIVHYSKAQDPHGLPKGEYMVLVFQSSFSQKSAVNELVTMVLESDGKWRVLTYQVQ